MVENRFNFPGGEVHIKMSVPKESLTQAYQLTHFVRNSDDILALFLITDAIRRQGNKVIDLTLPYVPYARQDRVMVYGEPLSIKVFTDLLNAQNYNSVTIWDPHSDVTPALINNCKVIHQHEIIGNNRHVIAGSKTPILVCPDAGARKKVFKVAETLGVTDIIFADKIRDVSTGKITGTTLGTLPMADWLAGGPPYYDRDFLIVDDIADGGFTFIELAKLLRPLTTGKIKLYVTHGIFSKGLQVFDGLIDEVYTANCWPSPAEVRGRSMTHDFHLGIVSP